MWWGNCKYLRTFANIASFLTKKLDGLTIKDYNINTEYKEILGKGAYGVVYKATNGSNETVPAKTIDGKLHPRVFTPDLEKLKSLQHKNIVRIFDFHYQGETLWIFMEICWYGDLNVLFLE